MFEVYQQQYVSFWLVFHSEPEQKTGWFCFGVTVTEDKIEDSYLSILLRSTIEARVLGTEKSVVPCIGEF